MFVFAQNQSFSPAQLDVLPGDTVIWRNTSSKTHNVKFETEGYNSGRFGPGEVRNHPFPAAGLYDYHCTIHTGMIGQVGVYPLVLEGSATRSGAVRRWRSACAPREGDVRESRSRPTAGPAISPLAVGNGQPPEGGGHEGHIEPGDAARQRCRVGERDLSRGLGRRVQSTELTGGGERRRKTSSVAAKRTLSDTDRW